MGKLPDISPLTRELWARLSPWRPRPAVHLKRYQEARLWLDGTTEFSLSNKASLMEVERKLFRRGIPKASFIFADDPQDAIHCPEYNCWARSTLEYEYYYFRQFRPRPVDPIRISLDLGLGRPLKQGFMLPKLSSDLARLIGTRWRNPVILRWHHQRGWKLTHCQKPSRASINWNSVLHWHAYICQHGSRCVDCNEELVAYLTLLGADPHELWRLVELDRTSGEKSLTRSGRFNRNSEFLFDIIGAIESFQRKLLNAIDSARKY